MKWLSKTGQSPGTSAVTGWTDWGQSPLQHVESAGPHSNQSLSSLCSCTILDTHGCTKPLLQAKAGAHHPPVPLLFPARGPWEYQCHEKPASSENLWSEHSHVPQLLPRKAREQGTQPFTYLKTMHFAQQKPPNSSTVPRRGAQFPHLQLHPWSCPRAAAPFLHYREWWFTLACCSYFVRSILYLYNRIIL